MAYELTENDKKAMAAINADYANNAGLITWEDTGIIPDKPSISPTAAIGVVRSAGLGPVEGGATPPDLTKDKDKTSGGGTSTGWDNIGGASGSTRTYGAIPSVRNTPVTRAPIKDYLSSLDLSAPKLSAIPTYTEPGYDESKIKKYAQEFSSPYIQELRRALQQGITKAFALPSAAERSFQTGRTMEAFGEGVGKVMGEGSRYGRETYNAEYGTQVRQALANFQANVQQTYKLNDAELNRWTLAYQMALKDYFSA